jgi:hypothetical protein
MTSRRVIRRGSAGIPPPLPDYWFVGGCGSGTITGPGCSCGTGSGSGTITGPGGSLGTGMGSGIGSGSTMLVGAHGVAEGV